jgi:outer membrane lipoprotein-sorting protein
MIVLNKIIFGLFCLIIFGSLNPLTHKDLTAVEIVKIADEKSRGLSSEGELTMTIVRPNWSREIKMKTWSLEDDFSMILITAPARDKGTAFLKRNKEMWNWQPSIDRIIKLPPSMMTQSWMGSDFTNDDLVKQSSIIEDYTHELLGTEVIEERDCYIVELKPKEDIAVTWDRVKMWIEKEEFLQLKTEYYDEEDFLINTILGKKIQTLGDRVLPRLLEIIPADEEGHKTLIYYNSIKFDIKMKPSFFSIKNMKRAR